MKHINWKMIRKAYELNPKLNLRALADRYHVNYATVRTHKARNHWKRHSVSESAVEVLDKYGLTGKQRLFCEYYLKSYNPYEAYKHAFCCKWSTAHTNAYRLLQNNQIQSALSKLHKKQAVNMHIDRSDVLNKMVRTYMNADPGKFVNFGNREVTSKNGRKYHRSYLYFKNNHGDTSTLQGIGLSRDGSPTVDFGNINRLGEFLWQILPSRADPSEQKGMPGSLLYAIKESTKVYDREDELKAEIKRLKSELKDKSNHHED